MFTPTGVPYYIKVMQMLPLQELSMYFLLLYNCMELGKRGRRGDMGRVGGSIIFL